MYNKIFSGNLLGEAEILVWNLREKFLSVSNTGLRKSTLNTRKTTKFGKMSSSYSYLATLLIRN